MQTKIQPESGLEYVEKKGNTHKCAFIFHGYGANMKDLYPLAEFADPESEINWFFPNAPIDMGSFFMDSRAWFPLDMNLFEGDQRDWESFHEYCPDELMESLKKLKVFMDSLSQGKEIYLIGGFSQGSMMAYLVSYYFGFTPSKLTLFSSTFCAKKLLEGKGLHPKTQIFQSHGQEDPVLDFREGELLSSYFKQLGNEHHFYQFKGGHEIPMDILAKWKEWL
jgi:phospholipase/carboxylesterase